MGIESIDGELIKLRHALVHNVIKNIELKKDKFEIIYGEKPKYVVVPCDCISLFNVYSDLIVHYTESCTILGMTVIESRGCKDFTDITVL